MTRGKMLAAERQWRRDQKKIDAVDISNKRSEFTEPRYSGAGLLGRALDTMYNCYDRGQKVRFEPPKPKDGAGRALFGRYRGAK